MGVVRVYVKAGMFAKISFEQFWVFIFIKNVKLLEVKTQPQLLIIMFPYIAKLPFPTTSCGQHIQTGYN